MKVRATRLGFYNQQRRRPGVTFELEPRTMKNGETLSPEKQFSKAWMEKVSSNGAEAASKPEAQPSEPKPEPKKAPKKKAKKGKGKSASVI